MKNIFLLAFLSLSLLGCKMNPSKEARIKQIESEMEQAKEKIDKLEGKIQTLESANKELESKIIELIKHSSN